MIKIIDAIKEAELLEMLVSRSQLEDKEVLSRVESIINNVKENGDQAILEYTRKFDNLDLPPERIRVADNEIQEAYKNTDKKLVEVIKKAKKNIENFHMKQKQNSWFSTEAKGILLGQMFRPLKNVGVYVPGGTAALISSVLMNVIPAKTAGVKKIVMTTPPGKGGVINPAMLVAASEAGVDEIYRIGGAQAIAAMAFGTETVSKVDKIVGPGNIYVATAKKMVYGYCDIDMFAGPSEIMIIADALANPCYIAADLLSQAEHDVLAASILVTTSEKLAEEVQKEIERQYGYLSRKDIIKKSLETYGAIVIVQTIEQAVDIVNRAAPEHLELCVKNPFELLGSIENAGAIFLGEYSSEPLGDYFAGPNHVLPTGGTARFFSPLSLEDFMKKSSIISYSRDALKSVKDDVIRFAEAEKLDAHANAIRVRFEEIGEEGNF
ncbi:MAG TPA: histidinol dehydrogenase [Clostridiaceae bacterium]|nr:histidinol dehydrogenase [Clostridiaceae bacterium]